MSTKHAAYAFSYADPASDDHPVIHRYVLDRPDAIPTFDGVVSAFLGFLSEVHGYEITPEMLASLAPVAA